MNALQKFEIPATWNCKRETANCRLRIPMKNLMLKVFNHSQTHMLAVFDPTKCWKNYSIPSRQASWANNLKKQIGRQGWNSKKELFAHLQGCHQYISRRMQHHNLPNQNRTEWSPMNTITDNCSAVICTFAYLKLWAIKQPSVVGNLAIAANSMIFPKKSRWKTLTVAWI